MKKQTAHAYLILFSVALLMAFTAITSACAQILDDTERSVDAQVLILRERQAEVRKGITIVNSTFQFPAAPEARVSLADLEDKLRGQYMRSSRVISIAGRQREHSYPALITFHEAAHWIDNRVLAPAFNPNAGPTDEASGNLTVKQLDAWRNAVAASATSKEIKRLLADPKTRQSDKDFLIYVSSPSEMWARSFCQYLTIKSGDPQLLAQLQKFTDSSWPYSGQWKGDDFAPIYRALDDLFSQNAWLKTPAAALERDG